MRDNNYIIKVPVLVLTLAFMWRDFDSRVKVAAARQYSQPYGDILADEDDNVYSNSFERRNEEMRYGKSQGSAKSFEQPVTRAGRWRGERERNQYQSLENNQYNRDNRNYGRSGNRGWMVSSSFVEMQHDNYTDERSENLKQHKCSVWVPMDAFDKYPDAEKKQVSKITGSVLIEICCKGYAAMRWRGKTVCRPVCESCQNGRCISPGVCECYDEYVANDNGDCVFTCPLGCLNGRCYLDGTCQCDPGYKLDASRKFCRPICSKGCGTNILHNCTEPEVCGCVSGYILTDNDCQPVCQHDCGIGGICRQPDTCDCSPGYKLKDGVCQADCYQKCDNGICFSQNRCICNPGFTYHERSTQCIPQ